MLDKYILKKSGKSSNDKTYLLPQGVQQCCLIVSLWLIGALFDICKMIVYQMNQCYVYAAHQLVIMCTFHLQKKQLYFILYYIYLKSVPIKQYNLKKIEIHAIQMQSFNPSEKIHFIYSSLSLNRPSTLTPVDVLNPKRWKDYRAAKWKNNIKEKKMTRVFIIDLLFHLFVFWENALNVLHFILIKLQRYTLQAPFLFKFRFYHYVINF